MTGKMSSTVPETTQVVDARQLRAFPIPLIQTLRFRGARGARETGLTWPRDCGCRARAPAALPAPRRCPSASQLASQSPLSIPLADVLCPSPVPHPPVQSSVGALYPAPPRFAFPARHFRKPSLGNYLSNWPPGGQFLIAPMW